MATLPPIRIVFKAVDQMSRQTREVTQSLRMVSTAANRAGMAMTAALTIPMAMAGANIISQVTATSKAFNTMRANTTLGATSYNELKNAAIDFAGTSQKSTAEVMQAMIELGRAGKNTSEIMDMYQSAVNLSIAGDIGADKAAQTLTNLMNVYGLGTQETSRVADMMAATVSGSAQNFEDFALSMEHGATNAKLAGMTFQEAMATSGMLANFGIRGSRGGTQMKAMQRTITDSASMMSNFGVTVTDAQGNIRNMTDIFRDMGRSLAGMTEAERVTTLLDQFGRIGVTGASAMVMNADAWQEFSDSLGSSQGRVQEMTAEMNVGLSGAFLAVRNAWGLLAHRMLGTEGSLLERILRKIADALVSISNLPTATLDALTAAAIALAAAGPALLIFGQILNAIAAMPALTKTLGVFAKFLGGTGLAGTAGTAVAGTTGSVGLGATLAVIGSTLATIAPWLLAIAAVIALVFVGWDTLKNIWGVITGWLRGLNGFLNQIGFGSIKQAFSDMVTAWKPIAEALMPLLKLVAGLLLFFSTLPIVVLVKATLLYLTAQLRILQAIGWLIEKLGIIDLFKGFNNLPMMKALVGRQPVSEEAISATASSTASAGVATGRGLTEEESILRIILPEGVQAERQQTSLYNVNYAGIGGV